MFLPQKRISRRTFLRTAGAAIPLPFLEAMIPAGTARAKRSAFKTPLRLCCIEMVHGSAGSTIKGGAKNMWAPAVVGRDFDLTPSSLRPLEPFRRYLTIVSNTDVRCAESVEPAEVGGDHPRSSAVFLTQVRPRRTEGADVRAGTSMDQIVAQRVGHETPIPSMQLCIEKVDPSAGGVQGYAAAYADTISWSSPTKPLPMLREPRAVFDQMFGVTAGAEDTHSVLDFVMSEISRLSRSLGADDRRRLGEYLDDVREVERRIEKFEAFNRSGEVRIRGDAPAVPDDFEEHVRVMFDLQVQAFAADITRVIAFKMSRDASGRVYAASGISQSFHAASHHAEREDKIAQFAQINKYHVSLVPYFLERLQSVQEPEGTLLDHSVVIYGSPMGDSNLHNHKRCPLFLAGLGGGCLTGNRHIKATDGTPMANVLLTLLHEFGAGDLPNFGDSTGTIDLNS
jgi:hypothetical protein